MRQRQGLWSEPTVLLPNKQPGSRSFCKHARRQLSYPILSAFPPCPFGWRTRNVRDWAIQLLVSPVLPASFIQFAGLSCATLTRGCRCHVPHLWATVEVHSLRPTSVFILQVNSHNNYKMSFLFGRGRTRPSTVDLPKQARELITKLEGPNGATKVSQVEPPLQHIQDCADN